MRECFNETVKVFQSTGEFADVMREVSDAAQEYKDRADWFNVTVDWHEDGYVVTLYVHNPEEDEPVEEANPFYEGAKFKTTNGNNWTGHIEDGYLRDGNLGIRGEWSLQQAQIWLDDGTIVPA